MLAGVALAATLIGGLGYTYFSITKTNAMAQLRTHSGNLLTQAATILVTEAANGDSDDFLEPPAGTTASGDGYDIPAASGAPKADAWGSKLRYCPWDNGSANASAGRLAGDNPGTVSSAILAVISAGLDKSFQTTCAQAKAGTMQGDDGMRVMSDSQVRQGIGGTAYFGDPVANTAALDALPAAAIKPGQARITLDTGAVYVNKTGNAGPGNWVQISGAGGSGGIITAPTYSQLPACASNGQLATNSTTRFLYVCSGGVWQVANSFSVSNNLSTDKTSVKVTGLKGSVLSPTTVFSVIGGTGPFAYKFSADLPPPVTRDESINNALKLTTNGQSLPNTTSSTDYTVVVSDSNGFTTSVALTLDIVDWVVSPGYASRNYAAPSIAGPAPDCSDLPGSWVGVPSMKIPSAQDNTSTITVPSFCAMKYLASRGAGDVAVSSYSGTPWGGNSFSTLSGASGPCNQGNLAGKNAKLMRETQWLAIVHNEIGIPSNWTGGAVNNGSLKQGWTGEMTSAQATNDAGKKMLSTGDSIYDIGGHTWQLIYDDLSGGSDGRMMTRSSASPAYPAGLGTGLGYDGYAGSLSTPQAVTRGGGGASYSGAFAYWYISSTDTFSWTAFRCTVVR